MIVAGFDEAGYGPKLGPLVLAYTAFAVDEAELTDELDLWDRLGDAVRRNARGDKAKLWIADSKAIKPRKDGHKNLELGVLACQGLTAPLGLPELLERLGEDAEGPAHQAWFRELAAVRVPAYAWTGEVAARAERLQRAGEAAGVRFARAGARVLDARRYNQRIAATQNKAAVLGETFVTLLKELRAGCEGPLQVMCDKHGGRSSYLRLLGRAFPMCSLDIEAEGSEGSVYRVETPRGEVRIAFRQKADAHSLPVALASMHCKYLRELFMDQLNAWFQARIPGLKGTAGYAVDAGRFLRDVEPALSELGVTLDVLVRAR